jgi:hypothetical protein
VPESDPRTVVETFARYWSVQDVQMACSVLADDCVLTMNIAQTLLPFAGEKRGREAIEAALHTILAEWDYIRFEFTIVSINGALARCKIDYVYRHRRSGADLSGTSRLNIAVGEDGITRIDEYHDAAMVEAFVHFLARH